MRKERKLNVTCVFPNGKESAEKLLTKTLLWLYDNNKEFIDKKFEEIEVIDSVETN